MMNLEDKRKKARRIAIFLVLLNLFLFLVKMIPTLVNDSLSVRADAFNSLGDVGYAILLVFGFEISFKPKDESHPHGHERFEPFISLVIAGAVALTGILILRDVFQNFFDPTYSFSIFFVIALIISIITKLLMSNYLSKKGKKMDSTAVISSSKDAKADVLASGTALVGVVGGWLGYTQVDIIVGLIVSVWIFKTAYSIGAKNIKYLTGASAPKRVREEIINILEKKEEIIDYHDLEAHYVGPDIHVSLSLHLPEELTFKETHKIEEKLRKKIKKIESVDSVHLHLEPKKEKNNEN